MPQVHDFLDRFRPAGAPGAAARAGVPADMSGALAAELTPVLALLSDTDAARGSIIARAERDARRIVAEARAQASAVAADAERRGRAARDEAARLVLAQAMSDAGEAEAAAARQAARVRELAAERMPALVSRAVDLVRNLPADPISAATGRDQPGSPGGQP
jgi:hypothetical protein